MKDEILTGTIDQHYKNAVYNTFVEILNKINLKDKEIKTIIQKINVGDQYITNAKINSFVFQTYSEYNKIFSNNNFTLEDIYNKISELHYKYVNEAHKKEIESNKFLDDWDQIMQNQPKTGLTTMWRLINFAAWKKVYNL